MVRHVIEIAIRNKEKNWTFGRFQVCGRDHLGSSLKPALAREPTSDNESNAISIVLPSNTLQHLRIRMKLAKSLLIFAKPLMNSIELRAAAEHRGDPNDSAHLLTIATC